MRRTWGAGALVLADLVLLAGSAEARKCKKDAVQVGNLCVDKYEASVWETTDTATIRKIQKGGDHKRRRSVGGHAARRDNRRLRDRVPRQRRGVQELLRGVDPGRDAVGEHHPDSSHRGVPQRGQAVAHQR